MEVYIQEVAAQSVLPGVRADQRMTIRRFSEGAPSIVSTITQTIADLPSDANVTLRAGVHM